MTARIKQRWTGQVQTMLQKEQAQERKTVQLKQVQAMVQEEQMSERRTVQVQVLEQWTVDPRAVYTSGPCALAVYSADTGPKMDKPGPGDQTHDKLCTQRVDQHTTQVQDNHQRTQTTELDDDDDDDDNFIHVSIIK